MKHFVVYATQLSPNQYETPEGYLYCENVPIARTGTQQYKGDEIGIADAPHQVFTIHRLPEQVFNPATIASFNGKPFTNDHPYENVMANNVKRHLEGVVLNVRRGDGEFSDFLMADIMVYDSRAIDLIRSGKVQISCGYECEYTPYEDSYQQTNIRGNHVALVQRGRAGDFVAIRDEDIKEETTERRTVIMADEKKPIRLPRKGNVSDTLKALGAKVLAADGEAEDICDAIEEMANEKFEEKAKDAIVGDYDRLMDENESLRNELEEANRKIAELGGDHEKLQGELKGFAEQEAQESVHQNPKGMEILNAWEREDDAASTANNIDPVTPGSYPANYSANNDDRGPVVPKEKQPWNPLDNESKTTVRGKLGSWKEISNDNALKSAYDSIKQGIATIPDDATRVAVCDSFVKLMNVQRANDEAYKAMATPVKDSKPDYNTAEYWAEHTKKIKETYFRNTEVK